MSARRPVFVTAGLAVATVALSSSGALPASADQPSSADDSGTVASNAPKTKSQIVVEATLRSNTEAPIGGFTCSDPEYPYRLDRAAPGSLKLPKGVTVISDHGPIVATCTSDRAAAYAPA